MPKFEFCIPINGTTVPAGPERTATACGKPRSRTHAIEEKYLAAPNVIGVVVGR